MGIGRKRCLRGVDTLIREVLLPHTLELKLPAPAYRQAGTPLGRDRHGGASRKGNLVLIVPLDGALAGQSYS